MIIENNLTYLHSLIQLCKRKNINILLFTPTVINFCVKELNKDKKKLVVDACVELDINYENVVYKDYFRNELFFRFSFSGW